MLFNLFIFICVIVVLIRHKRGRVAQKQEKVSTRTILRMMFSISGVMFLFGLTWLFAVLLFTVTELRNISQLLFTIFNSLQGFFIFIFILNIEAVGLWKKLIGCGSKPSSQSRPTESTQRNPRHLSSSQSDQLLYPRRTSDTTLLSEKSWITTERKVSTTVKVEETIIELQPEEVQSKEDLSLS